MFFFAMMEYLALAVESDIMAWDAPVEADAPTNLNHVITMIEDKDVVILHPLARNPEYETWRGMNQRCHNPRNKNWPRYGGRGITVCDEWRNNFRSFISHAGNKPSPRHSIDRIDNNGNYEPGNVRWATPIQQTHNSATPKLILITIGDRTQSLRQWSIEHGRPFGTVCRRYRTGWPVDRLFDPPMDAVISGAMTGPKLKGRKKECRPSPRTAFLTHCETRASTVAPHDGQRD